MKDRPSILLITWHDVGDWLGCLGHEDVRSPCLDRLAAEGIVFGNYFRTAPQCSPSRSSIVTGRLPHSTGVMGLLHYNFDMYPDELPLARILREAGYSTHLFGLQHECHDAYWEGYEDVRSESSRAETVAAQTERFFLEQSKNGGKPFFLALSTQEVHRPHGEEYEAGMKERVILPPFLPNTDISRKDMAVFYRNIKQADRHMGSVFDALDRSGLRDSTLVVFTTDHGPALPRAKMTPYDAGIKTALIMRWPKHTHARAKSDALLSSIDLVPTVLELIGVETPDRIQGRSFADLLSGDEHDGRDEVFAEVTWPGMYRPMRAIRTLRYKYIRHFGPSLPHDVVPRAFVRYGTAEIENRYGSPMPEEELYDLRDDPHELNNCAERPSHDSIKQDLRKRLMCWMQDTDDPILAGSIPEQERRVSHPSMWVMREGRFRFRVPDDWPERAPNP